MTEEKQQLINDMYAVRAQLSVAVSCAERIVDVGANELIELEKQSNEIHKKHPNVGILMDDTGNQIKWVDNYVNKIYGLRRALEYDCKIGGWKESQYVLRLSTDEGLRFLNKTRKEEEQTLKSWKDRFKAKLTILFFGIALLLAGIIFDCIFSFGKHTESLVLWIGVSSISIIVGIILIIYSRGLSRDNLFAKELKNRLLAYDKLLADYNVIKSKVKEIHVSSAKKQAEYIALGKALEKEIEKNCEQILDKRDWVHVDLIIYYLETGRADTIKEALNLVERETQTRRIISAIEDAANRICRSIEDAAERIADRLNVISNQLTQVINLQQVQIGQVQQLIGAAQMRNALLQKANRSSEQLVADVHAMRTYYLK